MSSREDKATEGNKESESLFLRLNCAVVEGKVPHVSQGKVRNCVCNGKKQQHSKLKSTHQTQPKMDMGAA